MMFKLKAIGLKLAIILITKFSVLKLLNQW